MVDSKGILKGLITIKDIEKATAFPFATKDRHGRLFTGAAVGTGQEETKKSRKPCASRSGSPMRRYRPRFFLKNVIEMIQFLKKEYKDITLMAGNVSYRRRSFSFSQSGSRYCESRYGAGKYLHHSCGLRCRCGPK